MWNKYSSEWGKLKTRVLNYSKVYIEGENKSRFSSIKNENEDEIRQNISRFLKISLNADDLLLSIKDLLKNYEGEIETNAAFDRDTADIFGYVNIWWVFEETINEFGYSVFLAEADDIGYKRTQRGEKIQPNELFDLEIAPNHLDLQETPNVK